MKTTLLYVYEIIIYIKNHHRLKAVRLCRPKELYADSKKIEKLELIGQLRKLKTESKIMGKIAIWTTLCFSPLPPLKIVDEK